MAKDFEKKKRRKLFAKIASGDWDIVIIPHSSFGFIGIAPETEERYLEKELALAEQAIKDAGRNPSRPRVHSASRSTSRPQSACATRSPRAWTVCAGT